MIVYGSGLSPFVRKVLVICAEKGIEVEMRPGGVGGPPTAEFQEASPFGKIPAIRDGDFTLPDSTAIAFYLEAEHPTPALIPTDAEARGRTIWFDEFSDTIAAATGGKIFFNRVVARLMGGPGDHEVADAAEREELPKVLDYLEGVLGDGREWLVADGFSLADIAVASPFVNLRHAGVTVQEGTHTRLFAYLARVHARPSFARLIAGETGFLSKALGG